ncbi:MAG: hypothetical protein HeimC3_18010 [Candidatus Heimdallarchaeota archaeon LC_3]|nr:MAG: hypothetical protein HeimC3_18010 [Candidatus Heimdallarchaeota archaeon LC_3]
MYRIDKKFLILLLTIIILISSDFSVTGQLDLREANVTNVIIEKIENSQYEFSVTLFHDDDGEEGYADFWQVETLNNTLLGKRILTLAHGTVEFTRSAIITIPDFIQYVVVRGHDILHEFGGQAMLIDLMSKNTHIVDQGSNNISLNGYETVFQSSVSSKTTTMGSMNFLFIMGLMAIVVFRKIILLY